MEIARRLMPTPHGPATVSTLKEAEEFAAAGVRDIMYAVGLAPAKLDRVRALRRRGVDLSVIIETREQAAAVAASSRAAGDRIPALIEIDCDDHRGGLKPDDPLLVQIGRDLHEGGAELRGVMTHAGGSYDAVGAAALERAAEQERARTVAAAKNLRDAGLPCPVVSVGSTPTAHSARDLTGKPYPDLIMIETNQEHGILALRPGSGATLPELPVGTLLRILPNHACATAAQHGIYRVINGAAVTATWPRFSGW